MNDTYNPTPERRGEPPPQFGRDQRPDPQPDHGGPRRDDGAYRAVRAVARPRADAERSDPGLLTGNFAPDYRSGHAGDNGDAVLDNSRPEPRRDNHGERRDFPGDRAGTGQENAYGSDSFLASDPAEGYGEFAWPEGYRADPRAMARFLPVAKKLGLDQNGAQELASVYAELDQERQREQARFIDRNNAEWQREIRTHPEFGGRNLARTGGEVAAMMRRYGSPLLMEQIRQMNVQNWPEMFYFLARVSQAVSEDCSPSGQGDTARAMSTAQLLFPGLK